VRFVEYGANIFVTNVDGSGFVSTKGAMSWHTLFENSVISFM
jgi:hypothetical protein